MNSKNKAPAPSLPGEGLDAARMPAHWLLARLGKRVLRPGGRKLTGALLDALRITPADQVVELAPGLGRTTRLILERRPQSYTGIERDADAAGVVNALLSDPQHTCRVATAQETGLDDSSATVVLGEAFLTMQPEPVKQKIVTEALRVLQPGGRYGLHELALRPDSLGAVQQDGIRADLSTSFHVGARPLTVAGWRTLLEEAGFGIEQELTAPMGLLRPKRVISDEGVLRALKILINVLRDPAARSRIRSMRANFTRHRRNVCAVVLVARKP